MAGGNAAGERAQGLLEQGLACRARGDWLGALNALSEGFRIVPGNDEVAIALGTVLGPIRARAYDARIEKLLVGVFGAAGPDYQGLAPAAAHVLVQKYGVREDGASARPFDAADLLLRAYLTKCLNIVPALEYALTRCRREMLLAGVASLDAPALSLATLIAQQCFLNEYVFFTERDEDAAVATLQSRVEAALMADEIPNGLDADMAVLAMYRPLGVLSGATDRRRLPEANRRVDLPDVVRLTLREPQKEQALKGSIRSFSAIEDPTSRGVRGQYEQNPYPRWVHLPRILPADLASAFAARFPHFAPPRWLDDPATILVAGCGTGRHAANVARQWPKAQILAIDLSTSSIAYAMRKLKELGIRNVEFRHGDILNAAALGGPFDMVQSVGVLHHMERPVEGWRVLAGLLRPGGLFHLGLYAERARHGVVAARAAIAREGIADDPDSIARFRRRVLQGEVSGDVTGLIQLADFFSTSNCRDLMFHVHEDTYTPARLKSEIAGVGLQFVGFNHYDVLGLNAAYSERFPEDPARTNLDNWEALERSLGALETGYDFWCWKPAT